MTVAFAGLSWSMLVFHSLSQLGLECGLFLGDGFYYRQRTSLPPSSGQFDNLEFWSDKFRSRESTAVTILMVIGLHILIWMLK